PPPGRLLELAALAPLDVAELVELGACGPTRVDVLGEAGFVVLGEELVSADLVEIDPNEVLVVALGALCDLGHVPSFIRSCAAILGRSPGDSPGYASKPTYNHLGFSRVPPIVYGSGARAGFLRGDRIQLLGE